MVPLVDRIPCLPPELKVGGRFLVVWEVSLVLGRSVSLEAASGFEVLVAVEAVLPFPFSYDGYAGLVSSLFVHWINRKIYVSLPAEVLCLSSFLGSGEALQACRWFQNSQGDRQSGPMVGQERPGPLFPLLP